ncbi:MAG: hypothetical protein M1497_09370 [Nitrospirae bacterium]|nr:hypothetical protein [Nitrospirota bacterium]
MVYIADPEKGIPGGDSSSNLVFEAIQPKKDVLERVTEYVGNRMNEGNVAEFKIECKFLK